MTPNERQAQEPPFDLAHKMQRIALDTAWQKYGHDDEYRERLVQWLREHGLAIWKLLEADRAAERQAPDIYDAQGECFACGALRQLGGHGRVEFDGSNRPCPLATLAAERQSLEALIAEWNCEVGTDSGTDYSEYREGRNDAFSHCAKALAEAIGRPSRREERAMTEWRPIETTPDERQVVLKRECDELRSLLALSTQERVLLGNQVASLLGQLAAERQALEALIARWREDAAWNRKRMFHLPHAKAMETCADELAEAIGRRQ